MKRRHIFVTEHSLMCQILPPKITLTDLRDLEVEVRSEVTIYSEPKEPHNRRSVAAQVGMPTGMRYSQKVTTLSVLANAASYEWTEGFPHQYETKVVYHWVLTLSDETDLRNGWDI